MYIVFLFPLYLGRLLEAQARFFDHHSTGGFLEIFNLVKINLSGEKCACLVLQGNGRKLDCRTAQRHELT